ncbi:hypothetical protein [Anthocerotibacter panamensis]|uniref:hypothetical protein n=1 Tax=Anthocerotibacter panamensis TaxID=2857077 RepID=UPI001C402678|nr:hypothetical protein [Anthocerotibacter panamensis]
MKDFNPVETAIKRILTINWEQNDSRQESHVALLQEYLRRITLWTDALDAENWPFFDIAEFFDLHSEIELARFPDLKQQLMKLPCPNTMALTCEWYIHWALIMDRPEVVQLALPAPYDPLILMYERGGSFYSEHGCFHIAYTRFPRYAPRHYRNLSPIVELIEEALDKVDAEAQKAESYLE